MKNIITAALIVTATATAADTDEHRDRFENTTVSKYTQAGVTASAFLNDNVLRVWLTGGEGEYDLLALHVCQDMNRMFPAEMVREVTVKIIDTSGETGIIGEAQCASVRLSNWNGQ